MRNWAAANLGESGQCVRSYAGYHRVRGSSVSVGCGSITHELKPAANAARVVLVFGAELGAQVALFRQDRAPCQCQHTDRDGGERPRRRRQERERDVERDEAEIERVSADAERATIQDRARRAAGQKRGLAARHERQRPAVPQRERGDERPADGAQRARDGKRIAEQSC